MGASEPPPLPVPDEEHIEAATNTSFPLRYPVPLPIDLSRALEFCRDREPTTGQTCSARQLRRLRTIADEHQPMADTTYRPTPDAIRSSNRRVRIYMLANLMGFTRTVGPKRPIQFAVGFPIGAVRG